MCKFHNFKFKSFILIASFILVVLIIASAPFWIFVAIFLIKLDNLSQNCNQEILHAALSPNEHYEAREQKTICENGGWGTFVNNGIVLYDTKSKESYNILGVDTAGRDEDRPQMAWISPTLLKIELSNNPFVKILTQDVQDVHIEIVYPIQEKTQPEQ